ncbi:hypothetical protein [Butyrivibrio sp. XPD2002]|nr:hypothetical protein [Butyrivibrio sp. XPD2002]
MGLKYAVIEEIRASSDKSFGLIYAKLIEKKSVPGMFFPEFLL